MGQKRSLWLYSQEPIETLSELFEMFKSPAHVHQELFAMLYRHRRAESIVKDEAEHPSLTKEDGYVTEEWLTKCLSHLYPGFDDIVAAAAVPVLYKIILHHGTYPFKPLPKATLTPQKTLIAVALLTANDSPIEIAHREDTGGLSHHPLSLITVLDW